MPEQDNLTQKQLGPDGLSRWAVFLPAISGFYATFIGRQRQENYVDPARMPNGLTDMEQLNWLNSQRGMFPYRWSLYSAGHANLDLTRPDASEDMIRQREPGSFMLGDSGGFQIAKGRWPGDWRDPNSPEVAAYRAELQAQGVQTVARKGRATTIDPVQNYQKLLDDTDRKRKSVLAWLDDIADYSMTLDIPTWVVHDQRAGEACKITTLKEAVDATKYNNEYFIQNRRGVENGGTKILNVLQGDNHDSAEQWYQTMKHYCDPKEYPGRHFDGWSMGGQNMCDVHLILRRLVALRHDNLLQPGIHDWMHFLGTSKLEWAVLLTVIQNAVRKYVNPRFTISFDCASPFLATANGQVYHQIDLPDRRKWTYRMSPSADDRSYSSDTRTFHDTVIQDKIFNHFDPSPVSQLLKINDICVYQPGQTNKNGKESRTSWDSFSYALLMAHNVWTHIESVQRANREFESGRISPAMMTYSAPTQEKFADIVDRIFATDSRSESERIIEQYSYYWMEIIGTRGFTGKRVLRPDTSFNQFFKVN